MENKTIKAKVKDNQEQERKQLSKELKTKIKKLLKKKMVKKDKVWENHLKDLLKNGMRTSINVRLPFL